MTDTLKITYAAARVNANLTQKEAAKALNVNQTTLLHWEKGITSPRVSDLVKMAALYDIPPDKFFLA